jgi:hypothetical protein
MSGLVEHSIRWESAQLDAIFNEDVPCTGRWHDTRDYGHDGGPARYLMLCPACRIPRTICKGRAEFLRSGPEIHCTKADEWIAAELYTFIEL